MTTHEDTAGAFFAVDRPAWRAWLQRHHASRAEVWLGLRKKTSGLPGVGMAEAVEEALCFGWIDGRVRTVDADSYALRFTPRRADSVWSESNKERVRRLVKEGRMTPAGQALVEAAKKSGAWRRAAGTARQEAPPTELKAALEGDGKALAGWNAFAPSYRRVYVAWVLDAKRDATRRRRVEAIVRRSAAGLKPGVDMQATRKGGG